jgi:hypothetical protein
MDLEGASQFLEQNLGLSDLAVLGQGKEGFVFADSANTFKVFRNGVEHFAPSQIEFLRNVLGSPSDPPLRILPIREVLIKDGLVAIVSPRLTGGTYTGGRWWELTELLRECRSRRIALTNIHPDNLLVSTRGVVYIDIGNSIEPLTETLWDNMVKRAFLTFRCPDDERLRVLMSRSLTSGLPELEGVSLLRHDVEVSRVDPLPSHRRPTGPSRDVSLLIRTCQMEWATIEFQVEHLVRQLEGTRRFREVLLVCDSNVGPFTRQYDRADPEAQFQALRRLSDRGTVDRVLWVPDDPAALRAVARRWFGCDTVQPLSSRGEPTLASLWALDQCETVRVLQTDSDMIVGRSPDVDIPVRLVSELDKHPNAIGVSLPPPLAKPQPYTGYGPEGKWRAEVRLSMIDRCRLEQILPLPNQIYAGRLKLPWYRALDARLESSEFVCLRGGDVDSHMLHIPNCLKSDHNRWFNLVKSVERGGLSPGQIGKTELGGGLSCWLGARQEDLVIVVRGRNVPLERLDRCIESLRLQERQNFGVVFIDAGSTNGMAERLEAELHGWLRGRASLYRNWDVSTITENIFHAIRELILRPDTIVALLDADDALVGRNALGRVLEAHSRGADLTVGSMLRSDRAASYPVVFENARASRGGNVWQHLRTFRKHLFDSIREEDLKIDGKWIPYAEDWALMLPLVELASHPTWIREPIYFYDPDPSLRNCTVPEREQMISLIAQKPSYAVASICDTGRPGLDS